MKKLFLTILCLCLFLTGFTYVNSVPVFAETQTNDIEMKLFQNTSTTQAEYSSGEYIANFKSSVTVPYDTYRIEVPSYRGNQLVSHIYGIDTSFSDIQWKYKFNDGAVNSIVFESNQFECAEAKFVFNEEDDYVFITPKAAGKIIIYAYIGDEYNSITLKCAYASQLQCINHITITSESPTEMRYEDLSSLILTVNLEFMDFMENKSTIKFNWYKTRESSDNLLVQSSTCVLTKSNVSPGETKIIVVVMIGSTTTSITAEKVVKLTKSSDMKAASEVQGSLEFDLDNPALMQPVVFTVTQKDAVNFAWYLLSPTSNVYTKQESKTKVYNFTPTPDSLAGVYKVFATCDVNGDILQTEIKTITIKAKVITEEVKFAITADKHTNSKTGVQACSFSINTNGYYSDEEIVWLVNGSAFQKGSTFEFTPSIANEYIISVKLVDNNDKPIGDELATTVVSVEATTTVNTWLYLAIASVALIGICIGSILISNKVREKVW